MTNPIKFALAIMPKETKDGGVNYVTYADNALEAEAVITVARTWLRAFEEEYLKEFTS